METSDYVKSNFLLRNTNCNDKQEEGKEKLSMCGLVDCLFFFLIEKNALIEKHIIVKNRVE